MTCTIQLTDGQLAALMEALRVDPEHYRELMNIRVGEDTKDRALWYAQAILRARKSLDLEMHSYAATLPDRGSGEPPTPSP